MPIKTLTRPALTLLAALPWRGNAPELRALLERLVLLTPHGSIRLEDVLAQVRLDGTEIGDGRAARACVKPGSGSSGTTSRRSSGNTMGGWAMRRRPSASSGRTSIESSGSCPSSKPAGTSEAVN